MMPVDFTLAAVRSDWMNRLSANPLVGRALAIARFGFDN
jgi:hypothetical protein